MATLELIEAVSIDRADGWHRVTSPGGYEWWEFDVEDKARGLRAVVGFYEGYPFHPQYLKRYEAYRRRPTLRMPPTPREYPCVSSAVYEGEKKIFRAIVQHPIGAFKADEAGDGFAIGENRLMIGPEEITIRLGGGNGAISGEIAFRAMAPTEPVEKKPLAGECPTWVLARPLCEAEGEIRVAGRTIGVSGSGVHDHYYATKPMGLRWMRGRVILPPGAVTFQVAAERARVLTIDETGIKELGEMQFSGDWDRRSRWGLLYPSSMKLGKGLIFRRPRVVDSSAAWLRLAFDAYVDGEMATAWVEIFYPERLKGSLARWWMNRSIRQLAASAR